jgi:hypothetical protein
MESIHKLSVNRKCSHKCYLFQWSIKYFFNNIEKLYVLICIDVHFTISK